MEAWHDFFVAQVGASAALTGLLFVSVSINLTKILEMPQLPKRAFQALVILAQILINSSLSLVPDVSMPVLGTEVLAIGVSVWLMMTILDIRTLRVTPPEYRHIGFFISVMSQIGALPWVVAGFMIATSHPAGLYWLVAGILLSYVKALIESWVLLIEINR